MSKDDKEIIYVMLSMAKESIEELNNNPSEVDKYKIITHLYEAMRKISDL